MYVYVTRPKDRAQVAIFCSTFVPVSKYFCTSNLHVTQPKDRELMSPEVFAVLATSVGGELHLAGYDASAALGGKVC